MRRFIKPAYDATIYEGYPARNTGLDEILEVGKDLERQQLTRALIKFELPDVVEDMVYYLNLFIADAKYINRYDNLQVVPLSSPWREGSGYFYQDVKNVSDGVTWNTTNGTTAWTTPGGDFTTNISGSFTFEHIPFTSRIRIDITDIIVAAVASEDPWYGVMLKFSDETELDNTNLGNIKFFSTDTHTIFAPRIEELRDEQTFATGSLKAIPGSNVNIVPRNIKEAYTRGEVDKLYLVVRDKYPDKRFDAVQRYRNQYYLPSESYYRIRDQAADIEIFPFDVYSAINCDPSGSYIQLDTSGLDINRYYDVELKVKTDDVTFFPEFKYTFKIDNDT
jgi:hypothetical protein